MGYDNGYYYYRDCRSTAVDYVQIIVDSRVTRCARRIPKEFSKANKHALANCEKDGNN